ncbi:sensor histidine kinase [Nocardioides coralli]|uniref:sensor histidine kinase n=1 Tax=Nocardioides coralli TaxID=2872154 RepID=UPI001CA42A05|nr:GAF domain-containing sensor histidine kinase [Nocardioides coralli]QZY30209.1 GAF domain-containing sensor histidine kinase [Nocardioides coralli]
MRVLEGFVVCEGDASFDHYARLVRRILQVPTSVVSIVEPRRQVFMGASGLGEPYATTRETPISHSFCQHVVRSGRPLVVVDSRSDDRVRENPAVSELDVISYAGIPVVLDGGRAVGSLCAIDNRPREWTTEDLEVLTDLAHACSAELQHAQQAASAGENLTREVFAACDVAVALYDLEGRLLLANEPALEAAEAAGYSLSLPPYAGDEVRAADNRTTVPHEDQLVPRALRGEHGRTSMQWLGPRGRQRAMIGTSRPMLGPEGTPWGTLVVAHDVSDLARALRVKDDFIATVSHELRTPLTSIIGYLEVVLDELAGETGPVTDALEVIGRNARNLQSRIGELLDIGDRRRLLETRPADVSGLVRRVAATCSEQARTGGVMLTVDAEAALWAMVDARRMEQVVENLVTNALKHTPQGGRVALSVSAADDTVTVVVRDDGVGMSTDDTQQAFDLFWRSDATRDAAVPGLGIGLTFARDVVEAHGGSIAIVSRLGSGTHVTVTIPHDHDREGAEPA